MKFSSIIKREELDADEFIINIHDLFMSEYGWIPLESFRKMPIPTAFNLLNRIVDRRSK